MRRFFATVFRRASVRRARLGQAALAVVSMLSIMHCGIASAQALPATVAVSMSDFAIAGLTVTPVPDVPFSVSLLPGVPATATTDIGYLFVRAGGALPVGTFTVNAPATVTVNGVAGTGVQPFTATMSATDVLFTAGPTTASVLLPEGLVNVVIPGRTMGPIVLADCLAVGCILVVPGLLVTASVTLAPLQAGGVPIPALAPEAMAITAVLLLVCAGFVLRRRL